MKKQYRSDFDRRQNMRKENYEIFYYSDSHFQSVAEHRHDYYELKTVRNPTAVMSSGSRLLISGNCART